MSDWNCSWQQTVAQWPVILTFKLWKSGKPLQRDFAWDSSFHINIAGRCYPLYLFCNWYHACCPQFVPLNTFYKVLSLPVCAPSLMIAFKFQRWGKEHKDHWFNWLSSYIRHSTPGNTLKNVEVSVKSLSRSVMDKMRFAKNDSTFYHEVRLHFCAQEYLISACDDDTVFLNWDEWQHSHSWKQLGSWQQNSEDRLSFL